MARPRKNSIIYFSHDADAWRSFKFKALRTHYQGEKGWAMEAKFWALNCMIGSSESCRLDIRRPLFRSDIARDLELSLQEFDEFIQFLSDPEACDLLNNEDGVIWTDRCQEELQRVMKARGDDRERKGFPVGNQQENGVIRSETEGKTEFSGSLKPDSGQQSGAEHIGAEHIDKELPSAPFPERLKSRLASAGMELDQKDLDACASKLIASSADSEAYIAFALEKCNNAKQPKTWFVKGILDWHWIEKWRENGHAIVKLQKQEPTFEELDKIGLLRQARESKKAGLSLLAIELKALQEAGEAPDGRGKDAFPEAAL